MMINRYLSYSKQINKCLFNKTPIRLINSINISNSNNNNIKTKPTTFISINNSSKIKNNNNNVLFKRQYSSSYNTLQEKQEKYNQYIDDAISSFNNNLFALSLDLLTKAIEMVPDRIDSFLLLGDMNLIYNRLNEYLYYYEYIAYYDPTNIHVLSLLGKLYFQNGMWDKSKQIYERIISLDQNNEYAVYKLYRITVSEEYKEQLKKMNSKYYEIARSIGTIDPIRVSILNQLIEDEEEREEKERISKKDQKEGTTSTTELPIYVMKEINGYKRIVHPEVNEVLYEAYSQLAFGYLISGQPKLAFQMYKKCQDVNINTPLLYTDLVSDLRNDISKQELLDFIDRYINHHHRAGPFIRFKGTRAILLYQLGRNEEAVKIFSELGRYFDEFTNLNGQMMAWRNHLYTNGIESIYKYYKQQLNNINLSHYSLLNELNSQQHSLLKHHYDQFTTATKTKTKSGHPITLNELCDGLDIMQNKFFKIGADESCSRNISLIVLDMLYYRQLLTKWSLTSIQDIISIKKELKENTLDPSFVITDLDQHIKFVYQIYHDFLNQTFKTK